VVEDGGHARWCQLAHARGNVFVAVVDRDPPELAHALVCLAAGGADHADGRRRSSPNGWPPGARSATGAGAGLSAALARELKRWARSRGIDAGAPIALRAVQVWTRLHGFVSLEIGGNFASMQLDPDKLFRAELERL
jgi:hypothetical protein